MLLGVLAVVGRTMFTFKNNSVEEEDDDDDGGRCCCC